MDYIETRKKILDEIRREILGPGSEDICSSIEHEIITDSPIERYSTGILYPQKNRIDENKGEDFDKDESLYEDENQYVLQLKHEIKENKKIYKEDDIDNALDQEINMANQYLPSSMGITFFIKENNDKLKLNISYAKYESMKVKECHVRYTGEDFFIGTELETYLKRKGEFIYLTKKLTKSDVRELISRECLEKNEEAIFLLYKLANQCPDDKYNRGGYIRRPVVISDLGYIDINTEYRRVETEQLKKDNLSISVSTRHYKNEINGVTIMLVNNNEGNKNVKNTIFQPEIKILSEENKNIHFIDIITTSNNYVYDNDFNEIEEEEMSLNLLYRNRKVYATGHGVSIGQKIDKNGHLISLYTDFVPTYEVPKLDFNINELSHIAKKVLTMENLSDISKYNKKEKIKLLDEFVDIYNQWIIKLEKEVVNIDDVFKSISKKHIDECKCAFYRMKEGIRLLERDNEIYDAFTLMNRALFMQRDHSSIQNKLKGEENIKNNIEFEKKDKPMWRPFQLAYILMCLSSIANPKSDYRDIVDLIWVPTGGGKTEAYLGLSAFTIFLRRIRNSEKGAGTTIIMRYTLRLLATQQFIRASIMICACELIRRENPDKLGKEEISIGLWIGSDQTPNMVKDAKYKLEKLTKKTKSKEELNWQKSEYNKFQILQCPWCGTKLEKEYENKKEIGDWGYRYSKQDKCIEIYCPNQDCEFELKLPIKIVDEDIYKKPPTLLFATVDKFATITWNGEVSKLFALDKENTNLSPELIIQDELHLISGPLGTIVGLYESAIDAMCSSKGIKPKIIASTATIRRAGEQVKSLYNRELKQFPPKGLNAEDSFFVKDVPIEKDYGRLYVGIMPSGKTQTTVEVRLMGALLQRIKMLENLDDKVKDKYWTMVAYFNSLRELGKCSTLLNDDIADNMNRLCKRLSFQKNLRYLNNQKELTSRLNSTDINNTLNELDKEYISKPEYSYPIDTLLATNMISVGVDVERLNCMVIVGQPKLTSEYIQASSRIGRKYPGIVFTLYNSTKTRDRSHYEQFYEYHQSFYKFVEPTSVTPFSEPARERALHAVFISMVRHILELNQEEMASDFNAKDSRINSIKEFLVNRAKNTSNTDRYDIEDEITKELNMIINWWDKKVKSLNKNEILKYSKSGEGKNLIISYDEEVKTNEKQTLQSMRNVDKQCNIEIITFEEE